MFARQALGEAMWKMLTVVLFVLVVVGSVVGQSTLSFNPAWEQNCTAGCNFNDPQIWIPAQVPTTNDVVLANFTIGSSAFLTITSPTSVGLLMLHSATLIVSSNLTISQLASADGSNFTAIGSAFVVVTYPTLFDGNMTFRDTSVLVANSNGGVSFSALYLHDNSVLQATSSACYFTGSLLVEQAAVLNCTRVSVSGAEQVVINQILKVVELRVQWGDFVFNYGVNAGFVSVRPNATLVVGTAFTAQVNVSGDASLTLTNVAGGNINYDYNSTYPALGGTGTLNLVGSSLTIAANPNVPAFNGTISGADVSSLNVNGLFPVTTLLATRIDKESTFTISGPLSAQNLLVNHSTAIFPSGFALSGVVVQNGGSVQVAGNSSTAQGLTVDASSSIVLSGNASFSITSVKVNGSIMLSDTAKLTGINITSYGVINVADNSTLAGSSCDFYGTLETEPNAIVGCDWANFALQSSNIQNRFSVGHLYVTGTLNLPNGLFSGYTRLNPNAKLTVSYLFQTQLFIDTNATAFVVDTPTSLLRVYLSLAPALEGTGSLVILNSVVNITGASSMPEFDGSVVLGGQSTLYARSISVKSLNTGYFNGTNNDVNVWGNGFEVKGASNFVGQVWVLDVTVSSKDAEFTGPVNVLPSGSFKVPGQLLVNGDITNNGSVTADSGSLSVNGNFYSSENSTFIADLSSSSSPTIAVNGSLSLNGNLKFSLGKQLKSKTFLVASTNGSKIVGNFVGDATPISGSDVRQTMTVVYSETQVQVKYSLSIHDLPAWIWVIVSVGGTALLLGVIAGGVFCVKRRNARKGYLSV